MTEDIRELNTEISSLEGTISSLETELEAMRIDMDNKDLLLAVAENNAQQSTTKVQSSKQELQNAIQRATAESVQRVSAYARNESLKGQVTQYEEQVSTSTKQIISLNESIRLQNNTIFEKDSAIDALSRDNSALQTNLIRSTTANKKGKIICNMLYEQGFIPQHIWAADEAFGEMMLKENRHVAMGYLMWAQSVVDYFTKNSQYSKYLYVAVKPWSEHMAHIMGVLPNDNLIGKGLHFVGCQYSLIVYNVVKLKRKYKKKKLSLGWL